MPDTTPPVLITTGPWAPRIYNGELTLAYTDDSKLSGVNAGDNPGDLYALEIDGVLMRQSQVHAVTAVEVDPELKTVALRVRGWIDFGRRLRLAYRPGSKNWVGAIQDEAGNRAAPFDFIDVINRQLDRLPPELTRTGPDAPRVSGNQLTLKFSDDHTLNDIGPPATAFTVKVNGVVNGVTGVAVNATAKTVTLTLATAVTVVGAQVMLDYKAPPRTSDYTVPAIRDIDYNMVRDLTDVRVDSGTDATAPVLLTTAPNAPQVNARLLVLTYTDTNLLNATRTALTTAFTVMVNGVEKAVELVTVNAAAKTVTLTFATPVAAGAVVTVIYRAPAADASPNNDAIQDATGNDADGFTAQPVASGTDTTAPVFRDATVVGTQLTLAYTEANRLDAVNKAVPGAFTVSVNGVLTAVTGVDVDAATNTVTLTLARPVAAGADVKVSYADPTANNDTNAIQDVAGNDAASFSEIAVASGSDATAPVLITTGDKAPRISGAGRDQLSLSYTEANRLDAVNKAAAGAFTVSVNGVLAAVTGVEVDAATNTVTLTLARPVAAGADVKVSYTDPTANNDTNAIQDVAGNDAASFSEIGVASGSDATAPVLIATGNNAPRISGAGRNQLSLSYTEANRLDAVNKAAPGSFTVSVNGQANTVIGVDVDAATNTVTLTLARPVAAGADVKVSYADPTANNDTNAIQDVAGNDAASFNEIAVASGSDATAPVFASAAVAGDRLTLTYTEANRLDAVNKPAAGAFTVSVNGQANTVIGVDVDAATNTVTLTLARPVAAGADVKVSYADPTANNDTNAIQDVAGNDAASFSEIAVASGSDATAPVLITTGDNAPRISGAGRDQLLLSYTEANRLDAVNKAAASAFTVSVNGVLTAVTGVDIDTATNTVTLRLASPVAAGADVKVSYADPTANNDTNAIQDVAGNDAASFNEIAVASGSDGTAPVLITTGDKAPRISGAERNQLSLSYTEANRLDAVNKAAAGAFTVSVNGVLAAVTGVEVDAATNTVTLTLARPVAAGADVRVSYADPTTNNDTNAIQDVAGNDAASFNEIAVASGSDATAPVFASAAVAGDRLTLTYTEANRLDAVNKAAAGAFTVSVNGQTNTVTGVEVDAASNTVTLTLASPVAAGADVKVSYADPTANNDTNAIQDVAGNDAASFNEIAVVSGADATAPVFTGATVSGTQLTLAYTEANRLNTEHAPDGTAFTVMVNGARVNVQGVSVNAANNTVLLTLASAVPAGAQVSLAYTAPTPADAGPGNAAIQDATGNDALSIPTTAVTSGADAIAPVFTGATVSGTQLTLTYTEANRLNTEHAPDGTAFTVMVNGARVSVQTVSVNAANNTVLLTLASAVPAGAQVSLAYAAPTPVDAGPGNAAIQDAAGNDALSIPTTAVTSGADATAPVFASATVSGTQLTLTYTEANRLNTEHAPDGTAFTVMVNGARVNVQTVSVNAANNTVALTLASAVPAGTQVSLAYAAPTPDAGPTNAAIQDAAGNDALSIPTTAVSSGSDATAPVLITTGDKAPRISGAGRNQLSLSYTEANRLDAVNKAAPGAFTVSVNGQANTVTGVEVDAASNTVTLTLARPVALGADVKVSYTDPTATNDTNAIQDVAGNDAASFSEIAVASGADATAPVFASATVSGTLLTLAYTEANRLDAEHVPLATAFTVMVNGARVSVQTVSVNAANNTVLLTLASAVPAGAQVSLAYAAPTPADAGPGNAAIQDAAGNDALSIPTTAVSSGSDATAPQLITTGDNAPRISGAGRDQLLLSYTEANRLDAVNKAAPGAFTVSVNGVLAAVTGVEVDAASNTVTLTLASPVAAGADVKVSYADPTANNDTNAIQDVAGNDAASFSEIAVASGSDATAPVFASATVAGTQLTLAYTEANRLNTEHAPDGTAFTVMVNGARVNVQGVSVDAANNTVLLTLASAVPAGAQVSLAYTAPTPSDAGPGNAAIQDAAGNDALSIPTTAVTSGADATAPVFTGATVAGTQLTLTYTEANRLNTEHAPDGTAFTVMVNGARVNVQTVSVDAANNTVLLTLASAVPAGAQVSLAYTAPTPDAGPTNAAIQDATGNDALSIPTTAVASGSDATAPVFTGATVAGTQLTLTYTEANRLNTEHAPDGTAFTVMVNGARVNVQTVSVNAANNTVLLTLASAVPAGAQLSLAYTAPTPADAGPGNAAIQDAAGNDALSIPVTAVVSGADATAPVFASATVAGTQLTLTYTEANRLNAEHPPAATAFTVMVNGARVNVQTVSVNAANNTVLLTLASAVPAGAQLSLAYTAPTPDAGPTNAAIQDATGNDALSIPTTAVTSGSDATAPVFASATVSGTQLTLAYTEANRLNTEHAPDGTAFTVMVNGARVNVQTVSVDAANNTVLLTLASAVPAGAQVSLAYAAPTPSDAGPGNAAIQDAAGNDALGFTNQQVTNNTPTTVDPTNPTPPTGGDGGGTTTPPANPRGLDTDRDSVPNDMEDQAPRNGDGNADGIADRLQAAVGSMNAVLSPQGESQPQGKPITSVTLVVGSQDGKVNPDSGARIVSMNQKDAPARLPPGLETPIGLVRFETTLASSGGHEKFSLYVDPALGVNGYWAQDRNGTWVNLASEAYGGKMVTEGERLRLDFQIEDGGQFDQDGQVNASITVPGAPAHMPLSIVGQSPGVQHLGFWF